MMQNLWVNLQNFHFIRPQWLWALAALLLLWLLLGALRRRTRWEAFFDKDKLEALRVGGGSRSTAWRWLLLAGWIIATLAAAGPSWNQVPTPTVRNQSAMVVLLDLSPSMLAEDLSPNRLTRAKYKLIDILRQRGDGQTALIAYAGDPHTVAPLTDDAATIEALLPALHPGMMPESGSNTEAAIELGMALLRDAGNSRGQLLLITDGVTPEAQRYIRDQLDPDFDLSILGVGTTDAVPIPREGGGFVRDARGEMVLTRLNRDELQILAGVSGGRYVELQADNSDIRYLLKEDFDSGEQQPDSGPSARYDSWEDMGYWLVLLLLPFAAWQFRKGLLFVLPLVLLLPEQSQALSWRDLWQTPDQQGKKLLEEERPTEAAEQFTHPQWQAAANYRAGNYAAAEELFAADDSASGQYNLGNALAAQGKLDAAIEAYERALELNPGLEDAAHNKAVVEELQKQQQQQESEQNQDPGENQNQENQGQENQKSPDQEQGQDRQQQEAGEQGDQSPQDDSSGQQPSPADEQDGQQPSQSQSEQPGEQQETQEQSAQQAEATDAEQESDAEEQAARASETEATDEEDDARRAQALPAEPTPEQLQDASEQWLRAIPDDPSGLLRRKFEYETRRKQMEQRYQMQLPENTDDTRY